MPTPRFLNEIGYLLPEPRRHKCGDHLVDEEIGEICGALVVPPHARYR